jgi:pimeloyl-ACP methyl ester carboxylesterase/ATP-dependent Clp protease adapter protein ClpS
MTFAVRLLNNDHTPMELVVFVLREVFGMAGAEATQTMLAIHQEGAAVCGVYDLEEATAKAGAVAALAAAHKTPLACVLEPALAPEAWKAHPAFERQLVPVEPGVEIEALDWGGTGPPLVFLAGLGFDAQVFAGFAGKFTDRHRVFSLSRRGFGQSSKPDPTDGAYASDRLGNDVLAVMEALGIERPVLVGHSFGGAEMSSVGSRYPERVSGLVYLDAGYEYALLTEASRYVWMQRRIIERLNKRWARHMITLPKDHEAGMAMVRGSQKYTHVPVPALAIFAIPEEADPGRPEPIGTEAIADAFAVAMPSARVVKLYGATHFVHVSNEADVLAEMRTFLDGVAPDRP